MNVRSESMLALELAGAITDLTRRHAEMLACLRKFRVDLEAEADPNRLLGPPALAPNPPPARADLRGLGPGRRDPVGTGSALDDSGAPPQT